MSSPFDSGRDSAVPEGNNFGAEPDVADEHVGAVNMGGLARPGNRLGEEDYRD